MTEDPGPPKRLARLAGALYLLMAILGGFAQLGVRSATPVPGDAAATAQHLATEPNLFRLAFVAVGAGMILTDLRLHQAALLELHGQGYALAGIVFGLWLLPPGYLGYRSGLFPELLSILLLIAYLLVQGVRRPDPARPTRSPGRPTARTAVRDATHRPKA